MKYEARNFEHLLGTQGFSDQLLKNHFQLYQGYVKNTNQFLDEMKELQMQGKEKTIQFAELSRRFGWEYNGMRLHEYYFGNMTKQSSLLSNNSELLEKIIEDFGSYKAWESNFKAKGAMRGIGWVILYLDTWQNKLFNVWIDEHDAGHLAGATPVLVMDVFEHAFTFDYGIHKEEYIEAFFKAIHWQEAAKQLALAHAKIHVEKLPSNY